MITETTWTITNVCPICLVKEEIHTRTEPKIAEARMVCHRCAREMDAPVKKTDTGIW